ncbi:MAG: glycoside hydrolase domain-containing protein [Planctomycetota bacterium]
MVLRVNLITEPQTIDHALEYTFGFQATPVKPPRPDVWDYRICHMGRYGMEDSLLDRLAELGVRTICFHEQWTDIQAYPKTTHGEELRKLVEACHDRNIQLLLYHGYEMSTIAPEWDEYHERCLVDPRRGGYKRKYQPEPDQTAYIVCYRSVWQDFIAHHLAKLVEEYGIDGVYLDGTSEPWGCANQKHGCGYVRPDGTVGTTYPIFDTRSMMRRIYTIVKAHDPRGQVNVHQSTCMTIPTLAFATGYWDGEQLQNVARKGFAQEVLPLDAFRTEFMGHNWGVPAELLHYASGPFKRFEVVSTALLHDVLVRPSSMSDVEESSKLWNAMDAFGRNEAKWLPYWESGDYVRTDAPGVKVSLYNRPGKGMIAVVANMGQEECSADVAFNLPALEQPAKLTGHDVLAEKEIPVTAGRLEVSLKSLECVIVRLKP